MIGNVRVSNIRITKLGLDEKRIKSEIAKEYGKGVIKKLTLPSESNKILFDLYASTSIAHGWRRVMVDEVQHPRFYMGINKIITDSKMLQKQTDHIQNRVWLIPTSYLKMPDELKNTKLKKSADPDHQYHIDITNNTTSDIYVMSSDIKKGSLKDQKEKKENKENKENKEEELPSISAGTGFKWKSHIEICRLMPTMVFKADLTIQWGQNKKHASFSNFGNIRYKPLEYFKINKIQNNKVIYDKKTYKMPTDKEEKALAKRGLPMRPHSYSIHPTKYELGCLHLPSLYEPKKAVWFGWNKLYSLLSDASEKVKTYSRHQKETKSKTGFYQDDELKVSKDKGRVMRYEFYNHTYTTSQIIRQYVFIQNPSIQYIAPGDDHPNDNSTLVRINHVNHDKIILKALETAMADVKKIRHHFE